MAVRLRRCFRGEETRVTERKLPSSDLAALDQKFWQQMERERETFQASKTTSPANQLGNRPASGQRGQTPNR